MMQQMAFENELAKQEIANNFVKTCYPLLNTALEMSLGTFYDYD